MLGIPIGVPCNDFCGNEYVQKNALFADSQLKKKYQSICFHRVRDYVTSNIFIPHKISTFYNLVDIITKSL